ncbi:hypothetical protein YK48G_18890 [Lentilactobacillus fungorum]|uniref:D-alanyl-D-alanine carboxypeptidase n=1 Tax=Lentilactobacillus fungorum TaxID=2201250 RepID=A0ABQ3W2Y0_9LACO|nr:hypothetical protein [Lentilactobacillus fungorum]GHP14464.1 hypothetical protein YK48G_18890 [Lentilactobacillus fungorum]
MTKSTNSKMTYIGLLAASMAVGMFVSPNGSNAQAASKVKIVSSKKMDNTQPYNITQGYLYSSPKLKVRLHNGKNYIHTTFYTNKATTVKKSYGVKSVYYYVFNKSKTVSGWTWHGNLTKAKTYDQEKSDISAMIGIINTMDSTSRGEYLSKMNDVSVQNAYRDISSIIREIGNDYVDPDDLSLTDEATIGKFYDLFKDRFSSFDREKLDSLYDNYQDTMNKAVAASNNPDDTQDMHVGSDDWLYGLNNNPSEQDNVDLHFAASNFADTLAKDITKLQE